jgi:hypothetical protein
MAKYPDWVLAHKKKGTYINMVKGKYYLYAAHSERIAGTKKVRRVCDGYLGRITEADGFIQAKGKLSDNISVYEFGLSHSIMQICMPIHAGLRREFKTNANFVMVSGVLLFMYGLSRKELYEASWLSIRFPGIDMRKSPTAKQQVGIERTFRMIADKWHHHFASEHETARVLLSLVRKVTMNKESKLASIDESIIALADKYGIDFQKEG